MKRKNVGFKEDYEDQIDDEDGLLRQRRYAPALRKENITHSTPEVVSRQPTQNIAVVGSRGAGVSSFIHRMTDPDHRGLDLSDSSREDPHHSISPKRIKNNAINFSNAKMYKCSDDSIPRPECYRCYPPKTRDTMEEEHLEYIMMKHVSFLDFPSHCNFVSCLLTGSTDLDAIILVVASDEPLSPLIATLLKAIDRAGINQLIILQNKVDNVGREQAMENYEEIQNCIQKSGFLFAAKSPTVPISVKKDKNVDVVIDLICTYFKPRERDYKLPPRLLIHHSFDPNPENVEIEHLKGGLVGGQVLQGVFNVGMKVEIRPGVLYKRSSRDQTIECLPMKTKITEMFAVENALVVAIPGGLVGICTNMDPAVCSRSKLSGQIVGVPGTLPKIWTELLLKIDTFAVSIRSDAQEGKVPIPIQDSERLLLNVGGIASVGTVVEKLDNGIVWRSKTPLCVSVGTVVSVARNDRGKHGESSWHLIGMAEIAEGLEECSLYDPDAKKKVRRKMNALPSGKPPSRPAITQTAI